MYNKKIKNEKIKRKGKENKRKKTRTDIQLLRSIYHRMKWKWWRKKSEDMLI